jgi:hypothetical protein
VYLEVPYNMKNGFSSKPDNKKPSKIMKKILGLFQDIFFNGSKLNIKRLINKF